jgi:hypothetical protein
MSENLKSDGHPNRVLSDLVHGRLRHLPVSIEQSISDFHDPSQEWRRLFSEVLGTFFLVLVAAGGGMMGQAFPNTISRTAAVVAPALMVFAVILFMGKVSGAHLNPAVSICVRPAGRLSVDPSAGLHHRPVGRGITGGGPSQRRH